MRTDRKVKLLQRRRWRLRKKVAGSTGRPRLSVRFTGKNIYAQVIDDSTGRTLASASTLHKSVREQGRLGANVAGAETIGRLMGEAALAKGIDKVVFDRSGAKYHGKVKALADAARSAGLQF